MIRKALLLASVLCVLNQTPVKAETYIEPYSHVTIEITEDYASSNDSFGSIELNGKYIQLPCKASLIFDLGFTPEEDVQAPSNKNTYSGVTDISWESDKQERSVDIRYEADVIKSITAEVRTPEEVFDYPYYDEVGLFSLIGDGHESSIPVKLPMLAVVILLVGVTGGICRVLWRHRRQKRTQEILNTPLEELADNVLKKYGEEGDE